MPFKSKAQQGMIGHLEDIGEVPEGTTKHWGDATPDIKNLPEHVSDKKKHKKEASYSYVRGYMAGYMDKQAQAQAVPADAIADPKKAAPKPPVKPLLPPTKPAAGTKATNDITTALNQRREAMGM